MTELSPAAQKVEDVFRGPWWLDGTGIYPTEKARLAAALHELADQVAPVSRWRKALGLPQPAVRRRIIAISAELEAAQ